MKIFDGISGEQRDSILEQSLYQIFQYLIDYKKQAHNFFQLSNGLTGSKSLGPLLFLDNDRARWEREYSFLNVTTCLACTFPKNAIHQLRKVGPDNYIEDQLGYLVKESLKFDPLSEIIEFFGSHEQVLNYRVASILDCVDKCILKFGESVLHDL